MLGSTLCLIYFFHMPLFVFISGMFSKSLAKRRERAFGELIVPFLAAQLLWLAVFAVTKGPFAAATLLFLPQYALWYLVALFIWRLLLPDLVKVRYILLIAAVLFFIGPFFDCVDKAFAIQKTLGFLFFFLLGYRFDADRVISFVRRVPLTLSLLVFAASFITLYLAFSNGVNSYSVLVVLCHTAKIGGEGGYLLGAAAYAVAFAAGLVLSVCFLRLALSFKPLERIAPVGSDTMPLYLAHGYVVRAMVKGLCLLTPLSLLPEPVLLIIFTLLTAGIVVAFSTEKWRGMYNKAIRACETVFLKRA